MKTPRTKTAPSKRNPLLQLREGLPSLGTTVDWFALGLLGLSLFALFSLATPWTGSLGRLLGDLLLGSVGTAAWIPLAFCVYVGTLRLSRREIPSLLRQSLGVLGLTLGSILFLGLLEEVSSPLAAFLQAGSWGNHLARGVLEFLGPLGAALLGLLLSAVTAAAFRGDTPQDLTDQLLHLFEGFPAGLFKRGKGGTQEPDASAPKTRSRPNRAPQEETQEEESVEPLGESDPFCRIAVEDLKRDDPEDAFSLPPEFPEVEPGCFPPPADLLGPPEDGSDRPGEETIRPLGERIVSSLEEFGIEAELGETQVGPTVIQFRIQPAPGVKVSRVASLTNDLALALAVPSLRVEAPIPGKPYVGIEIPNPRRRSIPLRTLLESETFMETEADLPLPLGVGVDGEPLVTGLEDLPHLLVAGTTGSGKSVFVNSCIVGLCSARRPDDLRLVLVDPKRVEMAAYERLPHILTPPVVDPKKAIHALAWAIREMEQRYELFARARVRNLKGYNEAAIPKDRLPHIVIVVDELADLMMTSPKEVEDYICRLAQMARATGIHLILATQRPSVNVITGLIKANIPARVAFTLPSQADSRTILDSGGAEKLLGKGDMLFLSSRLPKPLRLQAAWLDEKALCRWLEYLVSLFGEPQFQDLEEQGGGGFDGEANLDDPLLEEAVGIVLSTGIASASRLQRQLRVGFTRGARLIDMMEQLGIVGPPEGSKPREILVDEEDAQSLLERARTREA